MGERRTAEWEVEGLKPGQPNTQASAMTAVNA